MKFVNRQSNLKFSNNELTRLIQLACITLTLFATSSYATQDEWEAVPSENILILELDTGIVTIMLAPSFAPKHVQHIKDLVREGFYDDLTLYRVIENFVVQGGDPEDQKESKVRKALKAEFERVINPESDFTLVQDKDLLSEQTGFINGFAVGRDLGDKKEWLIHCPGVINLARNSDPNSGTTDFAILFGQAPRHLDRNMSVFGQVIDGWEALYRVKRGSAENGGVIENVEIRSTIVRAHIAADLPESARPKIEIENTSGKGFKETISSRKKRENDFYLHKGNGNLDVCYIKPKIRYL